jgi:N-acetylglucosaminyldiphosphoundecaprenol N-acetyl-beta-D-mannosaminyltransferase
MSAAAEPTAQARHPQDSSGSETAAGLSTELGAWYRAQKRDFLGLGLSCMADDEFLKAVREAVWTRSRLAVSFVNPDYVRKAHRTPGLPGKINRFDIVLPDGWGVVLGARWLGHPVIGRQGNDDICPKIFALSAEDGLSHFLLSYREGIAERAAATVTETFPAVPIAGTARAHWDLKRELDGLGDDPGMARLIEEINACHPDVLHVCLPTPLQQAWVWEFTGRLNAPVIITGGAYLDHLAERMYWYPGWVVKARLCWAYRWAKEPRRLWKRYSLDLAAYGFMLLRAKIAGRGRGSERPGTEQEWPENRFN